jgi:hypothetical protein
LAFESCRFLLLAVSLIFSLPLEFQMPPFISFQPLFLRRHCRLLPLISPFSSISWAIITPRFPLPFRHFLSLSADFHASFIYFHAIFNKIFLAVFSRFFSIFRYWAAIISFHIEASLFRLAFITSHCHCFHFISFISLLHWWILPRHLIYFLRFSTLSLKPSHWLAIRIFSFQDLAFRLLFLHFHFLFDIFRLHCISDYFMLAFFILAFRFFHASYFHSLTYYFQLSRIYFIIGHYDEFHEFSFLAD